tara:strand:+ start:31 stop:558 length:528 start_codon:yes stop_codon:yes gene_type:complete
MDKCSLCECDLPKERVHLGYKECLECSDTEKYASHVVYPHKTGGYIQPMSSEQANNMKRLDRRSTGGERKAKGIVSDKSWDRWLKNYYNPKPKKKKYVPPPAPNFNFLDFNVALDKVMDEFDSHGYYSACEFTQSLYSNDQISLMVKSKLINELTEWQSMSVGQRKFQKKLANNA